MSESSPHRTLHLVLEGFPLVQLEELAFPAEGTQGLTEVYQLTESNAGEALQKIFAADTVAVWGSL